MLKRTRRDGDVCIRSIPLTPTERRSLFPQLIHDALESFPRVEHHQGFLNCFAGPQRFSIPGSHFAELQTGAMLASPLDQAAKVAFQELEALLKCAARSG